MRRPLLLSWSSLHIEYLAGPGEGDTSYELALCRWGLSAALALATDLGLDDPRVPLWRDRLDHLANFSASVNTGIDVARGLPFTQPHRHFSHLLGVVLNDPTLFGDAESVALVGRSLDQWRALRDPCALGTSRPPSRDGGWTGFSYAASSLLHSRLGRAAEAWEDLTWMAAHSAVEGITTNRFACPLVARSSHFIFELNMSAPSRRVFHLKRFI